MVREAVPGETGEREAATVEELGDILAWTTGGTRSEGTAFGRPWPVVHVGPELLAPAVPVAVATEERDGPDGVYRRGEGSGTIERETRGAWRALVAPRDAEHEGSPPDLLVFGAAERVLLRAGVVEIEDAFSRLTHPATAAVMERVLLRGLRLDPKVIASVSMTSERDESGAKPRLEVGRQRQLLQDAVIHDPLLLIQAHPGVRSAAEARGDMDVSTESGNVRLAVERSTAGWTVRLVDGRWPFRSLHLAADDVSVQLAAEPVDEVDLLAPGMRTRIAFDLLSDLVALSPQ